MPDYKLYLIDLKRGISKPPVILDCLTDEDAIAIAERHRASHLLEIWQRDRLVARLDPHPGEDSVKAP